MTLLKLLGLFWIAFGDLIAMLLGSSLVGIQFGWHMGLAAFLLASASRNTGPVKS